MTLWADVEEGGRWTLGVTDRGVGIDSAAEAKMFDPFYTTKDHGTGLGLAIVHSIIKAHGGEIEVSSKKGEGTRVQITLPKSGSYQGA